MDILKHSICKAIYDLGVEIEKLPASEQATKLSVMVSKVGEQADKLVDALRDSLIPYRDDTAKVLVTEERMEAWRTAAEV